MSIDNSKIVDAIGTEKDGSGVTLTISDHLAWDCRDHLLKLQDKLNTYLAFIESGEIYDTYPSAKGKKIRVVLACKHNPNDEGLAFLNKCREQIEKAGIGFYFKAYGS